MQQSNEAYLNVQKHVEIKFKQVKLTVQCTEKQRQLWVVVGVVKQSFTTENGVHENNTCERKCRGNHWPTEVYGH